MVPFLNRAPTRSRISAITQYITPAMYGEALRQGAVKLYRQFAGVSPQQKEEAELRRLNIESLKIQRLRDGSNGDEIGDEAKLRKHRIENLHEEDELRRLKITRQRKEVEYREMEADLCALKIQQLQSPNDEETELRRQKLRLLQDAREEESQVLQLKIEKLTVEKDEAAFREVRMDLFKRRLRNYDEKAELQKQAQEALERYRKGKLKCLKRQTEWSGKRKGGDVDWNFIGHGFPTPKRRKYDDGFRNATPRSSETSDDATLVAEESPPRATLRYKGLEFELLEDPEE